MKVWSAIFNFIAVILLAFLLIVFYRMDKVHTRQFEEQRLRYAMDYATEAAFRSTLAIDDLGMDYSDLGDVKLNPSLALETYKSIISLNYDMAMSEENFAHIENFIPTAVLFTNDGYYVLEESPISDEAYGLTWSLKKPYLIEQQSGGSLYLYAVNIYSENWSRTTFSGRVEDGLEYTGTGLTRGNVQLAISETVNKELNSLIYKRNLDNRPGKKTPMFYLPSNSKSMILNSIERPGLLVIMQNVDFAGEYTVDSVSIGGTRVDRKKVVVGFIENGIRYYCYEKQLPLGLIGSSQQFYDTVEQAADAGYTPHFGYLSKPINRDE